MNTVAKIVIDTREQNPLVFRKSKIFEGTISKMLNVGDYSLEGYEDKIAFERKEIGDLFGTLGKGHKRFKKELERAKDYEYFAIIIESPFNLVYEKSYSDAHYSKMQGHVIISILCTLILKYGIDVFWCNSRNEASSLIRNMFKSYLRLKDVAKKNNNLTGTEKSVVFNKGIGRNT